MPDIISGQNGTSVDTITATIHGLLTHYIQVGSQTNKETGIHCTGKKKII